MTHMTQDGGNDASATPKSQGGVRKILIGQMVYTRLPGDPWWSAALVTMVRDERNWEIDLTAFPHDRAPVTLNYVRHGNTGWMFGEEIERAITWSVPAEAEDLRGPSDGADDDDEEEDGEDDDLPEAFTLRLCLENDVFSENAGPEVARVLHDIADRLARLDRPPVCGDGGRAIDVNGNLIGEYGFSSRAAANG